MTDRDIEEVFVEILGLINDIAEIILDGADRNKLSMDIEILEDTRNRANKRIRRLLE